MSPRAAAASTSTGSTSKRTNDLAARRAEAQGWEDDPVRATIMEAMLVAAGELGYREVAIHDVLARCGGHRVQFWQRFSNKEDCFAAAHEAWTDRLTTELLTAALATGEWAAGVRAGIVALLEFAERRPQIAKALLIEAEIAGGAPLARREEMIERLGGAIDSAREQVAPGEAPPPFTGLFVAGGIATYVSEQLAAGNASLREGLPELVRFATGPYLDEAAK